MDFEFHDGVISQITVSLARELVVIEFSELFIFPNGIRHLEGEFVSAVMRFHFPHRISITGEIQGASVLDGGTLINSAGVRVYNLGGLIDKMVDIQSCRLTFQNGTNINIESATLKVDPISFP